ncbi:S-adenosylmethionine sensor upstream of mTORC1-like isoform X1 [Ostrea edulis]|uniref:S-adenosylmethionine sensor upstream of mTORC1-like isoform X1 n=1 Tax=Ostrea edulis TaxID=37623 RepID=UPI0024AFEFB9|nr:S-adenosylmethionine sensor upstream of mTORC1-like isoform X1 [Ostrea edulis]XP_048739839.2 S-adenosylmethionine sensor upstream of mTORC1-like isoform X1 [Ostrea edulis]
MSEDTEEKKKLASFVKSVHKDLRKKFKTGEKDIHDIWKEHCKNTDNLRDYSEAMQKLATVHWGDQQSERIQWCRNTVVEYFSGGGQKKCIEKDCKRLQRQTTVAEFPPDRSDILKAQSTTCRLDISEHLHIAPSVPEKPLVLDVGSCYNPFKEVSEFEVIGIDLYPATEDVYQCDFLTLEIHDDEKNTEVIHSLSSPITRLPSCGFNVIIFCLLLEYFPSRHQRWKCCTQAHKLLAPHGLLIIISPDSHKQHRNSSMIRNWTAAITSLGFSKWKYEKLQHIHCIVFRKTKLECSAKDEMADLMVIHQDALEEGLEDETCTNRDPVRERNDEEIRQAMFALPGRFSDSED